MTTDEPTDAPGKSFLKLSAEDQREAYLIGSEELGRSSTVLEKDVWLCWTLDSLFECPNVPNMAFKGGTSLSKVFNAIARFSEDIDVTMDHSGLVPDLDPYDDTKSRKQRDKDDALLRAAMLERSNDAVVPHLRARMAELGLDEEMLEIGDSGAELTVRYPHLVDGRDAYYREGVKIEFGGRNMIEPNETHLVTPYLAVALPDISFPGGEVAVLSPQRTFWEKVTLAHADSNRPEFRKAARHSRHWYDLAVLSKHTIGQAALKDLDLLAEVVRAKERFFRTGVSQYQLCLEGRANLLPTEDGLDLLRSDYEQMVEAQMLEQPLPFDEVVERVRILQDALNQATAR